MLHAIIYETFIVEMCRTLIVTLTFNVGGDQLQIFQMKEYSLYDYIFVGSINACPIYNSFKPDQQSKCIWPCAGPLEWARIKSKYMPIDRPYVTFYLLAIVTFVLSVTVCDIIALCKPTSQMYSNRISIETICLLTLLILKALLKC